MQRALIFSLSILVFYCTGSDQPNVPGIYALWHTRKMPALELPYIKGGQVHTTWAKVDKKGTYDWTSLDTKFSSSKFTPFTIQINGGKPNYLFDNVPFIENLRTHCVRNPKGILMYWHPNFICAHRNLLHAYGEYLKNSPFRASFLGIRLNYNAIGTEHIMIPKQYRDASLWTTPVGVCPGPDWSLALRNEYAKTILDTYIQEFIHTDTPIFVFIRNHLYESIRQMQAPSMPAGYIYKDYFYEGKLGWFHTSSEIEPRAKGVAYQYKTFLEFCRPGYTLGYTEPWASAWGYHGHKRDSHWCTPPQWNYWRLLSDLNMGISFIGVYSSDLLIAQTGTRLNGNPVGEDYQQEFDTAFRFAAKYAGYHVCPAQSPGAWIAFRQSIKSIGNYNTLVTDYTMHMELLNPQDTIGLDARHDGEPVPVVQYRTDPGQMTIGPYNARYGAWARKIPQNNTALLKVNPDFIQQLNTSDTAEIHVTYLDNATGSFILSFGNQSPKISLTNSGQWKTAVIPVKSVIEADASGAHIKITSKKTDIIFHMVEIAKIA